jgi:hypothetical protein
MMSTHGPTQVGCSLPKKSLLRIDLPIRLGTGYQWFMKPESRNIHQEGEAKVDENKKPLPGALQSETFTIRLLNTGVDKVTLTYLRDPEVDSPDAPHVILTLNIH